MLWGRDRKTQISHALLALVCVWTKESKIYNRSLERCRNYKMNSGKECWKSYKSESLIGWMFLRGQNRQITDNEYSGERALHPGTTSGRAVGAGIHVQKCSSTGRSYLYSPRAHQYTGQRYGIVRVLCIIKSEGGRTHTDDWVRLSVRRAEWPTSTVSLDAHAALT